jgi:archaeal type IV pilus assembly protein PilA
LGEGEKGLEERRIGGERLMRRKFKRNLMGISTVIATIIIVSISIVMAIAVAYWAMGIGNSFTKFEKIEFTNVYSDSAATYTVNGVTFSAYRLNLTLKNTGSATATIDTINLNGRPYTAYTATPAVAQANLIGASIQAGRQINGVIYLPTATGDWRSGDYVALDIGSTAGRDYLNTVNLP